MENFTRSFANINLNENRCGGQAPYHNLSRQVYREQHRDPPRATTVPEEQRNNWAAPANQQRRADLTMAGGSKGNYFTGPRSTIKCWTCGQEGHASQGCTNPPLPVGEQDRLRSEFFARRAAREKDNNTTPASGSNALPIGNPNAQPIGVHQVEEIEHDGIEHNTTPRETYAAEAFKFDSPYHRPTLDDWDTGDESVYIRDTYQCENCSEGEEAMALGDKRLTVEYEEDDTEAAHAANRNGPRKVRRVSGSEITFAPEPSTTSKRPIVNPRSREALQTLQPPIQKSKTTRATAKRGSPPELKPRGMQNQSPWDAGSFLRGTKLDLTLAQFLHFSPKARAAMAEAIRLEPNPNKQRRKITRFSDPLEVQDEMEGVSTVEDIFLVARNDDYVGAIEPFGLPPPNKRKKCSTCGRSHYNADNSTKYFPMPHMSSTSPQLQIKGNFYTTAFINARKSSEEQWKINKCLIDPGATINLISERTARKIKCIFHDDTSIAIRSANGATDKLPGYTNLRVTIADVPKILRLYVVPGKVNYNMILGRPWLRMTSAIGLYATDEYWIKDTNDVHHKVQYVGPSEVQTPEVFIAEDVDILSEAISDILELGKEEQRTDEILRQIIKESQEEE